MFKRKKSVADGTIDLHYKGRNGYEAAMSVGDR